MYPANTNVASAVPTPVGVNLKKPLSMLVLGGRPHARGGEPCL